MRSLLRLSAFGMFLLMYLAAPASAQIMRITTDNPTDNTALNGSGTTLLTITLDPSASLEGHTFCNWSICEGGPSLGCYAFCCPLIQCVQPYSMEVTGYDIILTAVGGTVTWGTFTPANAAWHGSQTATSTRVQIGYSQYPSVSSGLFTLGTIPVTTTSPFTHIEFVRYDTSGWGTWLEMSNCFNFDSDYPNPYLLGDRSKPCEPTDWYDAYGTISAMDACLAQANHGQCEVCCKDAGLVSNTCAKFCDQIKVKAGEPQP